MCRTAYRSKFILVGGEGGEGKTSCAQPRIKIPISGKMMWQVKTLKFLSVLRRFVSEGL